MSFQRACGVLTMMIAMAATTASDLQAAGLKCAGILGNSGEQGDTLVRFGPSKGCRGLGVVCDRFGSLWDRGGQGVLNRYAPDGRQLASYEIPPKSAESDQLTLIGDRLVLLLGGQIYTLSITAPPQSKVEPLAVAADCVSFGAATGRVAAYRKGKLFLIDPASGKVERVAEIEGVQQLEVGPDGAIYVQKGGKLYKFVDGKLLQGEWPKGSPGERMQYLDGYWFGHAWHGTIRRFAADLAPAPGVVLGGGSGSFIGHLPQNAELSAGRGMARLDENLYAVSGTQGILHLLRWDGVKQQFRIVRRIGAASTCGGIGLDRNGNVWWYAGSWRWSDGPDAPLEQGIMPSEMPGDVQAVMLDNDQMVLPSFSWGKPCFFHGPLTDELRLRRIETACRLKKDAVGTAVYRDGGKLLLLSITSDGAGSAFAIGPDGDYRGEEGEVQLQTSPGVRRWTTLAMKDSETLLGAADGQVLEMAREGKNWRETRRWNSWAEGPADKFGDTIYLAADAGRLWVSDCRRHRALAFALDSGKLEADFGAADQPGADLSRLSSPQLVAARGDRAVVFDSGNQRLIKLQLTAPANSASAASSAK